MLSLWPKCDLCLLYLWVNCANKYMLWKKTSSFVFTLLSKKIQISDNRCQISESPFPPFRPKDTRYHIALLRLCQIQTITIPTRILSLLTLENKFVCTLIFFVEKKDKGPSVTRSNLQSLRITFASLLSLNLPKIIFSGSSFVWQFGVLGRYLCWFAQGSFIC